MSIHETTQRFTAWRGRLHVWWLTIAVFAIVIAYADGFWVTTLQGAVGAIERRQPPLGRWLHDSTLMLPLFFLAVLAAVLIARRRVGQSHSRLVKYGTTALLIVVLSSGVAIAEVTASSAYDYHLQTRHIELKQQTMNMSNMDMSGVPVAAGQPGSTAQTPAAIAAGTRSLVRDTLKVHVRAVLYGSLVLLITNLVLVLWVLALRGDRLWRRPDTTPMSPVSMVPEELSLA